MTNLLWEGAAGPAGAAVQPAPEGWPEGSQPAWRKHEARGSELGAGTEAEAEAEAAQSPAPAGCWVSSRAPGYSPRTNGAQSQIGRIMTSSRPFTFCSDFTLLACAAYERFWYAHNLLTGLAND